MSIIDALGTGVMPRFTMRNSFASPFTNVSQDMLNTAAAGEAMRQSIADKYSSDISAFTEGTAALKDIFGTKEPSIEDLFSDSATETISSDLVADEEPGFSFSDIFSDYTSVDEATGETTDQSTGEAILARGTTGLALSPFLKKIIIGGKGNPFATTALAIPEVLRIGGNIFAPEATAALEESIGAGYNEYIDPYVAPVMDAISEKKAEISAAQDIEDEIFRQGLIDQGADEASPYFDEAVRGGSMTADELDEYENMILDPLPSFDNYYAHGGRVHKGLGGIMNNLSKIMPSGQQQQMQQTFTPNRFAYAYSPFMDAQQGFDYYTQFQAPTYPVQQAVPVPNVPGEGEDRGFSPIETLPIELDTIAGKDFGTLSGPVKGGGDNRPVSRFEANPTTMGFNDQGKVVYTNVNPYTKNVKVGDEVPFVSPMVYGLGYLADKTTKFLENKFVPESVKNIFSKQKTDVKPKVTFNPAAISKVIDEAPATPTGKVDPKKAAQLQEAIAQENNKYEGNIGKVKGQPFGGFTANQISKGKLVGYGYDAKTGKYKGAVQTKHGPLVSDPTKNKKLQAIKNRFGKNKNNGGGNAGAGGGSGKGCFVKGTMIEMADGTEKEITTITVGELTRGGVVEAKLEFMPTQIYNYKGVEVSGSHLVMENNQFIKVEDSKRSVLTDKIEPVYCFETSDNRIWVKGIEFGDYLTGSHEQWQPHIDAMLETVNLELNGH
jgi:hypothetical protein